MGTTLEPEARPPRVSVIVPARNEGQNIGVCISSLLKHGDSVEIIVVDDASEDDTATVVRKLAREAPQVRLISVQNLPIGWTGKNHAAYVGAESARGDWLLFTDADTNHEPGALNRIVEWAERQQLELVSFSPRQELQLWWEKAVLPLLYQQLERLFPYDRVSDPMDPMAAASGAYLLIRRPTYWQIGGHAAVRDEILEDVALARRAKEAGHKIWFGDGAGVVRVRLYRRFSEMWEGWTKNLFALYGRDSTAVYRAAVILASRYWIPAVVGLPLLLGAAPVSYIGTVLVILLLLEHLQYSRACARQGRASWAWLLIPGAFLLFLLLLNSERRYSRQLGVRWKGRTYSVS